MLEVNLLVELVLKLSQLDRGTTTIDNGGTTVDGTYTFTVKARDNTDTVLVLEHLV